MNFANLSNKEIKRLAAAMQEAGLTELEVQEGEARIRLSSGAPATQMAPVAMPAAAPVAAPVAQAEAAPAAPKETLDAPMVGTFYHAASPDADAFVQVGDAVKKGQTIGIIEAMKTMNHVAAEQDGVVAEVLVADGSPVQFGTPLVALS